MYCDQIPNSQIGGLASREIIVVVESLIFDINLKWLEYTPDGVIIYAINRGNIESGSDV
jgi:hypothetical protein